MTTITPTKTTSVAQPILAALSRAASRHAQANAERLRATGFAGSEREPEARDRMMEEPERWDGMA